MPTGCRSLPFTEMESVIVSPYSQGEMPLDRVGAQIVIDSKALPISLTMSGNREAPPNGP
jgi:hypothetical protein